MWQKHSSGIRTEEEAVAIGVEVKLVLVRTDGETVVVRAEGRQMATSFICPYPTAMLLPSPPPPISAFATTGSTLAVVRAELEVEVVKTDKWY